MIPQKPKTFFAKMFKKDSPFKQKVEKLKTKFTRKQKYINKTDDYEEDYWNYM
jgi:hypothetical protein